MDWTRPSKLEGKERPSALALEAAEEVFGHGVVIGIALAGHALPDADVAKQEREILTSF